MALFRKHLERTAQAIGVDCASAGKRPPASCTTYVLRLESACDTFSEGTNAEEADAYPPPDALDSVAFGTSVSFAMGGWITVNYGKSDLKQDSQALYAQRSDAEDQFFEEPAENAISLSTTHGGMSTLPGQLRPALGHSADLGDFYGIRRDCFIPLSLLPGANPSPKTITITKIESANTVVIADDTLHEKFTKLGLGNELAASFLTGMVPVSGSGYYLRSTRRSDQYVEGAVLLELTTERMTLDLSRVQETENISPDVCPTATRVVAGITFGARTVVAARLALHDKSLEAAKQLQTKLEELASYISSKHVLKSKSSPVQDYNDENGKLPHDALSDLTFAIFSDISHLQHVQNVGIKEVTRFMDELPSRVAAMDYGRGVNLFYTLVPINSMQSISGFRTCSPVAQPSDVILQQIIRTFDQWNRVERAIHDYHSKSKAIFFRCPTVNRPEAETIESQLESIWEEILDLKSDYRRALLDVRSLRCTPARLTKVLQRCYTGKGSPKVVEPLLSQAVEGLDLKMTILDHGGVGKSTFINAFCNYMTYRDLDDAMTHEKLETIIPSSFTIQRIEDSPSGRRFIQTDIRVGESDKFEVDGSRGDSATQKTGVYRIPIGDRIVRIIDTPGVGDELLTYLHRDAATNIIWGFTNTRQSNYMPGDSYKPLERLLQQHESLGLSLTPDNVFCFDSESFRCLAAQKQGCVPTENLNDFRRSWERSAEEKNRLLQYVSSLQPHSVTAAKVNDAKTRSDVLKQSLHYERVDIELHRLPQPRTVCKSPACVDFKDVGGVKRPIYKSLCHDPCYLTRVTEEVVGHAELIRCSAFSGHSKCQNTTCGHHWREHMHMWYSQEEKMVTAVDPEVQSKLQKSTSKFEARKTVMQGLEEDLAGHRKELEEIRNAASQFGLFLKRNSITPYNDAMISYLDVLIKDEWNLIGFHNSQGDALPENKERLKGLVKSKSEYQARIKVLKDQMTSPGNIELLDEQGVEDMVKKLYSLPRWGSRLKGMRQVVEWSKAENFREQQFRPRVNKEILPSLQPQGDKRTVGNTLQNVGSTVSSAISNGFNAIVGVFHQAPNTPSQDGKNHGAKRAPPEDLQPTPPHSYATRSKLRRLRTDISHRRS
ncbi:hypothetical protein DL762_004896 [Monosporascus cannonballus]|uniref:G domain-containing protein n=1 Tax=Monosporascus cannonballus TaxID=155416 RepID=A0ABY0H6E2_9PEZI|nr:hypothetical protein DL762_004896 [Monosporascus cannonballus]